VASSAAKAAGTRSSPGRPLRYVRTPMYRLPAQWRHCCSEAALVRAGGLHQHSRAPCPLVERNSGSVNASAGGTSPHSAASDTASSCRRRWSIHLKCLTLHWASCLPCTWRTGPTQWGSQTCVHASKLAQCMHVLTGTAARAVGWERSCTACADSSEATCCSSCVRRCVHAQAAPLHACCCVHVVACIWRTGDTIMRSCTSRRHSTFAHLHICTSAHLHICATPSCLRSAHLCDCHCSLRDDACNSGGGHP
jgi:hypothetical protein